MGTEKIVEKGGPKIVTGEGLKYGFREGDNSWDREGVGRGNFWKND